MDTLIENPVYLEKTTLAFYPSKFCDNMIEVTTSQHEEAVRVRNAGGTLSIDDNDQLVITPVDPAVLATKQEAQAWSNYQQQAKVALQKTSVTIERCFENNIPLPSDWVVYRKALRAILGAQSGDSSQPLPIQPAYPEGT